MVVDPAFGSGLRRTSTTVSPETCCWKCGDVEQTKQQLGETRQAYMGGYVQIRTSKRGHFGILVPINYQKKRWLSERTDQILREATEKKSDEITDTCGPESVAHGAEQKV